jgi:threonine dehydrogenase-like Zn-dependent dehydrogenase
MGETKCGRLFDSSFADLVDTRLLFIFNSVTLTRVSLTCQAYDKIFHGSENPIVKTGKVVAFIGPYCLETREYPIPDVGDEAILLKIEAASICGSDGRTIKGTPIEPSCIGHEFAGRIVKMGSRANDSMHVYGGPLKVGDRIVPYPWLTCGTCDGCRRHGPGVCMICENGFCYGGSETIGKSKISASVATFPHFKGGFAEYTYLFPGTYVWKIPEHMPSEIAALLDPMAVALHAIDMTHTESGVMSEGLNTSSRIVVVGAGAIGTMVTLILKIMGVEKVILTNTSQAKLQLATSIAGADEAIALDGYSSSDRVKMIRELTSGGADLVFQCANTTAASLEGLQMVRKLGTFVEVGVPLGSGGKTSINFPKVVFSRGARIMSLVANNPRSFDRAFQLLKRHRQHPFAKLVTHRFNTLDRLLDTMSEMSHQDYIKGVYVAG